MGRLLVFIYGIVGYAVGMAGLVWFILYVGGWEFLPKHIDSGTPGPVMNAVLINLGLMLLFGLHHSVTARPGFKAALTKVIPAAAERSTYVLLSGVLIGLICYLWQPLSGNVWHIENSIGQTLMVVGYGLGWFVTVLASFVINHFELFGLQQVYLNLVNKPEPQPNFTDRFLYKLVRHPIQLGILMGVWFTPSMSVTHLMLSVSMTVYIFIGLYFEERDLVASLGDNYVEYQSRVPKVVPFLK